MRKATINRKTKSTNKTFSTQIQNTIMSKKDYSDDDEDFLSLIKPIQDIDMEQAKRELKEEAKKPKFTLEELQTKKAKVKAARYQEKQQQAGIVYIGRVPPLVGPTAVRSMLSQFGTILRVFFQPESDESLARRRSKQRSAARRYDCGWIEFSDKRHAKKCAVVLNGQSMSGNTKSRALRDDLWMLQYLSKVKWDDLRLQHQHESEIHTFKTTQALEAGRAETSEFLRDFQKSQEIASNHAVRDRIKQAKLKMAQTGDDAGDDNGKRFEVNDKKRKLLDRDNDSAAVHVAARQKTTSGGSVDKPKTFRKLV